MSGAVEPPSGILIVGAGAVGGSLGAALAAAGRAPEFFVRAASAEGLRHDGLHCSGPDWEHGFQPRVTADPAELSVADVVILTVKSYDLVTAVETVRPAIGPETIVVTALNGVPWWFAEPGTPPLETLDPGDVLRGGIGLDRLVASVVDFGAARLAPGKIKLAVGNRLSLGAPAGDEGLAERVAALFAGSAIQAVPVPDIRSAIWTKLLNNGSVNPISALSGRTLDVLVGTPHGRRLVSSAMHEILAVGQAMGIDVPETVEQRIAYSAGFGAFKTSMLQDVEAGRRVELGALVGAVVELGARMGVTTPTLSAMNDLVTLKLTD